MTICQMEKAFVFVWFSMRHSANVQAYSINMLAYRSVSDEHIDRMPHKFGKVSKGSIFFLTTNLHFNKCVHYQGRDL